MQVLRTFLRASHAATVESATSEKNHRLCRISLDCAIFIFVRFHSSAIFAMLDLGFVYTAAPCKPEGAGGALAQGFACDDLI